MIFVYFFPKFGLSFFSLDFVKKIEHLDLNKTVHFSNNQLTLLYPCESTTVCTPYRLILPKGKYQFEVWGANGGNTDFNKGGIGGYSSGDIILSTPTLIYVTIGGKGSHIKTYMKPEEGGYNGGGNGWYLSEKFHGAGGGGATDIRINKNTLFHRVIVAGGGGGAGGKSNCSIEFPGGSGGGKEGIGGTFCPIDGERQYFCVVSGGNETDPGFAGSGSRPISFIRYAGFGTGGSFLTTDSTGWASAGGGAGWYGGSYGCVYGASGAGGSGYVFTEKSIKPEKFGLKNEYFMTNEKLLIGKLDLHDASWAKDVPTNGNGAVRITFVDVSFDSHITIGTCKVSKPYFRGKLLISIIVFCS